MNPGGKWNILLRKIQPQVVWSVTHCFHLIHTHIIGELEIRKRGGGEEMKKDKGRESIKEMKENEKWTQGYSRHTREGNRTAYLKCGRNLSAVFQM